MAIPRVVLQMLPVAIVIFVPETVTGLLDKEAIIDPTKVVVPAAAPSLKPRHLSMISASRRRSSRTFLL
ncbi:MAG: hypothetical protein U1E15_08875 [Hyphomicrobiales bacterium]